MDTAVFRCLMGKDHMFAPTGVIRKIITSSSSNPTEEEMNAAQIEVEYRCTVCGETMWKPEVKP